MEMARRHDVLLCPVHQYPFQRSVASITAAVAVLAPMRHIDITMCSAGAAAAGAPDADTVALEMLPHPLSLVARLAPAVLRSDWLVQRFAAGEYRLLATADGLSASVLISMAGRPTANTMRVIGDGGTAHADLFHGFAIFETGAVSRARKMIHPFSRAGLTIAAAATNLGARVLRREPAYPGLIELVTRFYSAASNHGPSPIAADEVVAIADAIEMVRQQALT
jgi:hypothetical protein